MTCMHASVNPSGGWCACAYSICKAVECSCLPVSVCVRDLPRCNSRQHQREHAFRAPVEGATIAATSDVYVLNRSSVCLFSCLVHDERCGVGK